MEGKSAATLPRTMRLVTVYVNAAMTFGIGVWLSSLGGLGKYDIVIGPAIVLLGALYNTILGIYLWPRLKGAPVDGGTKVTP